MICEDVNERSVDGDDLERLGYTQYRGGNRENVYKVILTITVTNKVTITITMTTTITNPSLEQSVQGGCLQGDFENYQSMRESLATRLQQFVRRNLDVIFLNGICK